MNTETKFTNLPMKDSYFHKVFLLKEGEVSFGRCTDMVVFLSYTPEESFVLTHQQDCCESVVLEDLAGDLSDLQKERIVVAEVAHEEQDSADDYGIEGFTFYKFRTNKGSVTIRFQGTSNGFYGIGVDCIKLSELPNLVVAQVLNIAYKNELS